MNLFLISGTIIITVLLLITGSIVLVNLPARPENKIKNFRTRFNKSIWSNEQMELLIKVFYDTWIKHYPERSKEIRNILNNTNIYWKANRWKYKTFTIAAQVLNERDIKIWHGPKLKEDRYRLSYTTLPEAILQLIAFRNEKKELTLSQVLSEYTDFLREVKEQLHSQVAVNEHSKFTKRT